MEEDPGSLGLLTSSQCKTCQLKAVTQGRSQKAQTPPSCVPHLGRVKKTLKSHSPRPHKWRGGAGQSCPAGAEVRCNFPGVLGELTGTILPESQ